MKKVLFLVLMIVGSSSLLAVTPNYITEINSDYNEYPICVVGESFYYFSDRMDTEQSFLKNDEQKSPFYFYIYELKPRFQPAKVLDKFCTKCNEFPAVQSNSLQVNVFTKINDQIQERSLYNQSLWDKYTCDNNVYDLELNRYGSWSGQPALSPSGKVIVFASNRNGSSTLDLYASIKNEYGYWGQPLLLDINTKGDEMNPHFGCDGYFYYSSNFKNDSIGDFDIYRATYIPRDGVLIPFDGKKMEEINTEADDYFPVQTPEKFYFSSNRKAENALANIYSISNESTGITVKLKSNLNEIWIKNSTRAEYLCLPNREKVNLKKGNKYSIILPEYLGKIYNKDTPVNINFDFTKQTKDTTVVVEFNVKSVANEQFIAASGKSAPLFIRGYWKPFNDGSFADVRTKEKNGYFKNTTFVDTTVLKYNELIKDSESKRDEFIEKTMNSLDYFSTFLPASDSLIIDLKVLSDEIDVSSYKNKYRKSEKESDIYCGDTVTIGKDKNGNTLVVPTGLDITESSWMMNGKKIKISNDGNELLAKLRAYYTYKYLDSVLMNISPIYKYYSLNKKLVFNYDGFVIDEKGDLPQDYLALTLNNKSTKIENSKLEDKTLAYDFAAKIPQKEEPLPESKQPGKPLPKLAEGRQKISVVKMLEMRNAPRPRKPQAETQAKTDKFYTLELFNLSDYKTAYRAYDILNSKLVKDIKLITAFDFMGKRTYLIRADKFETMQEAQDALRDYRWVYSYVGVEGMGTVIEE